MKKILTVFLLAVAGLGSMSALAVTPANTLLTNSAKLTYTGNETTGITASVTVTVELTPTAVTIAATFAEPEASVNKSENQDYSATYTVQSNANGLDTYTIASAVVDAHDITGTTAVVISETSLSLGATALIEAASIGDTVLFVPDDGSVDGAVNGLVGGGTPSTVIINGIRYTIASIDEAATGSTKTSTTITLTTAITVASIDPGEGIYEYDSFDVTIADIGTQDTGSQFFLDLTTTVTSDTDVSKIYTREVDINIATISVIKYVRNVTDGCTNSTCGGSSETYDNGLDGDQDYYTQGVNGAPGDTLEYLLVIGTGNGGTITNALMVDDLAEFTTYTPTTTRLNAIAVDDETGPGSIVFPLDSTADDGGLLIEDGDVTRTTGAEGSGNVDATKTVNVTYKITIDG